MMGFQGAALVNKESLNWPEKAGDEGKISLQCKDIDTVVGLVPA